MANNNANVALGKPLASGGVFKAPITTPLPTSETTAKNAAFKGLGYISDAGVVRTIGETSTNIKAWGGTVVRKVVSDHDVVYKMTFIESLNGEALDAYYGDGNVTVTAAGASAGTKTAIRIKANAVSKDAWILELFDSPKTGRVVIPNGEVTSRGDVSYLDTTTISYPVEITAYEDATGVKAYEYWDDGVFAP